ncbi:Hydrogenase expression/formation protein HypD [Maioricimonas rarisocia]|uniref:Hydrogenase expression/formation protein HypD n=1 Tax=Maioricimonas rarisocia TaxID=2528026 RepID=A0A517Z6L1_9PLAN|nr:hydrogenase formation protein HypD [Maioricimonas rarisocia]QDU38105.1 Hydrogenase expression/formation protein HypD [Maioricimonas rarisocia]
MKYVDEFRDSQAARKLVDDIRRTATRQWVLMEVCGGQTHSLLRHGIEEELRETIELIHGPGCPVCVTPAEDIDFAQHLASREEVLLASFGDMLRVPGSRESLLDVRARGGNIRIVYSPLDAVTLAQRHPDRQVVFFAVGFETTAPATALAVRQAERLGLDNFSLLVSHVRVQPAMEAIMLAPGNCVEGFLAAGHVCTITGYDSYEDFVQQFGVPVAVTGFEPIDLLEGIRDCVRQLESGQAAVTNCYTRSVRRHGNEHALAAVDSVYEIADVPWRGFGVIPSGGLRLQSAFERFDARQRFDDAPPADDLPILPDTECPAADVLAGLMRPTDCPQFGSRCTPDSPLGAPMVSSEGACAAYFRYRPLAAVNDSDPSASSRTGAS